MKILCYLFFSILFYQYGNSTISIDSVKKTDSRCSNSGSITVYANTTNVFYNYEIGSNISSPQSSNTFLGLASGTYKVKITNVANEVDSTYVTISSTYTFPNFNQSVLPTTCKNNSDGKVIGKPVINSGVKPYLWTLKNNNNGSTITQLSDTFTNLISGDYTLTMSDSCLNTTVHNFVLSNTVPSIGINFSSINKINCRKIYFRSYVTFGTQYSPTIVKYKYLNTEIIKTAKVVSNYINDTFDMDYKSNENVSITIYNSCGDSATTSYTNNKYVLVQNAYKVGCDSVKYEIYSNAEVSTGFVKSKNGLILLSNLNAGSNDVIIPNMSYQDTINFSFITICNDTLKNTFNGRIFNSLYRISSNIYLDSCREKYSYQLQKQTEFFSINLVNVKLINKSTRIVLKDTNINSSVNLLFKNYPSNTDYTVLLTDKCGVQDSLSFYWNSPYPKILGCNFSIQNYTGCVDSTATIAIYHSGFASFAKIANFTGPKIAKSTKPKYSYSDSFVYKDSLLKANIDNYFYIRNLSVGKYSYRISDTCGNVLDTFFNIDVENISNNFYEYSIVKACQDNNRLKLKLFSIPINYNNKYATGSFSIYDVQNNKYLRNKTGISFNHTSYIAFFDSFDYLSAGKYILKINYSVNTGVNFLKKTNCIQVIDTIIIPQYQRPQVKSFLKVQCNNSKFITLNIDSNLGVPPYKFEINQGPQIFPIQYSNRFEITKPGSYQAKVSDTCGFESSFNFYVDSFKIESISVSDSTCSNSEVLLAFEPSPFVKYRWLAPNGKIYLGDSVLIKPVNIEDIGMYQIIKYVNINLCKDTSIITYDLQKSKLKYIYDTIIEGDSVFFKDKFLSKSGIYHDTILRLPCDSFTMFNLFIKDTLIVDTDIITICNGDSVLFRGKFIKKSGIYTDTLDVADKPDLLFVLKLKVNPKIDSIFTNNIHCNNYTFNSVSFFEDSIFRDTMKSSLGCDSILYFHSHIVKKTKIMLDTTISNCDFVFLKNKYYYTSQNRVDSTQIKFKQLPSCDSVIRYYNIAILSKPSLSIISSIPNPLNIGDTVVLQANGGRSYDWNNGESDDHAIVYPAFRNKSFQLVGTSIDNCHDTIFYRVIVADSFHYTVSIPKAFTPNGDGHNDELFIRMTGIKKLISFKVFNRLGQAIFITNDEQIGWDGLYHSQAQNSDMYFYTYEAVSMDDKKVKGEGNLLLLR